MYVCIGLDVHAKLITGYAVPLSIEDEEEKEFCAEFNREFKKIPAEKSDLLRMASWLKDVEHSILIENSTKTHEVFWTLVDAGCTVVVANARDLYRITKSVKKTDYHDSKELASYMRRRVMGEDEFAVCLMVDDVWMNRRQICRIYAQSSFELSDMRRRIRSYMLLRGIKLPRMDQDITAEYNLKELESTADTATNFLIGKARTLVKEEKAVIKEIGKEFADDRTYKIIKSIPGFGVVTSAYLTSVIIDIDRFESPNAFAAYFGIVPKQRESSDRSVRCGSTHRGDEIARQMLATATHLHISKDTDRVSSVSRMYDKLKKRGLPHKKALIACANKMAHIIYALLKKEEAYQNGKR